MKRLFVVVCVLAAICLLPIGTALVLDFWEAHAYPSFTTTSIWVRDLLGITTREHLVNEAAEDSNGGAYIRWAIRRGVDPNRTTQGIRPIDWIMYHLSGGCDPPLDPFEALARSGVDLDKGADGGLLGFAARECRRPDLVLILLAAGADPARAGGYDDLVRGLGDAAYRAEARDLWTWLLDHGAAPCGALGSIDDPASMLRRLTTGGLADLVDRATAACAMREAGGGAR